MRTILDVPYMESMTARAAGAKYDAKLKITYYDGAVPAALARWLTDDYSYSRWVEDSMNGAVRPVTMSSTVFTPKPHQVTAAHAIASAWAKGSPGFLIADSTGLGKTLSVIAGVCAIASVRMCSGARPLKTLIVSPLGAKGVWSQTLKSYPPSSCLRPLIINYQQLNKLVKPPTAEIRQRSRANKSGRISTHTKNMLVARDGTMRIHFDVIVFDESHYLKNYGSSAVSMLAATIGGLNSEYVRGTSPFIVYSTATPASTPFHYAIMAPTLSILLNPRLKHPVTPVKWPEFLKREGFHVHKAKTWSWATVPYWGAKSDDPRAVERYRAGKTKAERERREDSERIGKAWSIEGAPYIAREPTDLRGWPKQPVNPYYISPTADDRARYEESWLEFRAWLKLKRGGQSNPRDGLTKRLRFRQKASLIKAPYVAEHAIELVESGMQVFIGVQFLDTVRIMEQALAKARVTFADCTGLSDDKQAERLRFQRGEAKVVLCTVKEAMSFHAGEILPDGTRASSAPRMTIIADVRENPNDCVQQMGRAHRDGQESPCEFPLLLGTVDEKVMGSFIRSCANMKTMKADSDPEYLDRIFLGHDDK